MTVGSDDGDADVRLLLTPGYSLSSGSLLGSSAATTSRHSRHLPSWRLGFCCCPSPPFLPSLSHPSSPVIQSTASSLDQISIFCHQSSTNSSPSQNLQLPTSISSPPPFHLHHRTSSLQLVFSSAFSSSLHSRIPCITFPLPAKPCRTLSPSLRHTLLHPAPSLKRMER